MTFVEQNWVKEQQQLFVLGKSHLHFIHARQSCVVLPCRHCFSSPLPLIDTLPLWQPGSCREEEERRIYISLTLPRPGDASLLLAPAGPLEWTAFEDGVEKEQAEGRQWRTGAVATIPRLAGDLYAQDATQGDGSEYQIPLHHVKKVLTPDDVIQSGLKPAPC